MGLYTHRTILSIVLLVSSLLAPAANGEGSTALPDSILTENHIYKYLYTDRDKSEQIMDEMRRRQTNPTWELDYIEGDIYYNTGRSREALKYYNAALESAHVKGNDTLRMELLHRQISCYDVIHDEVNKMRCIEQLMKVAKETDNKPMQSIALFNLGKSLHYQGDSDRGFRYMEQGVEMMDATDYRLKYDNLRYEYKTLVLSYEREHRYQDVLRTLDAWEKIVSESTGDEAAIDGLGESELKDLYAMRTVALSRLGRKAEASDCYKKFCQLDRNISRNNYLIMPYLFDTRRYDEIIHLNLPREQYYMSRGDTVNYHMTDVLRFLGYAYRYVGEHEKASRYFERLAALRDSLKYHEQESAAQDYAALYESREKDLKIRDEQEKNRLAWMITVSACLLFVVAGGFALVIVYKNRQIRLKNKSLTNNLNEMFSYKDEFLRKQAEVIALRDQLALLSPLRQPANGDEDNGNTAPMPDEEADRLLFDRLKYEIESRKLFLVKDFEKEVLAKQSGISVRKLAKLFPMFAGKSFAEYMQDLRLSYAAVMLRDYPHWTIEAVADTCCMSLRTFHRLFTKKFGMTPQLFQKQEAQEREAQS